LYCRGCKQIALVPNRSVDQLRSFPPRRAQDDSPHLVAGARVSRLYLLGLGKGDSDEWETFFAPRVEAALEWANAFDAVLSEEQRHTGAGGFVRSSTVENHFTIAGQAVILLLKLASVHAKSAGDGFRVGLEVHGMPQIDDDEILAGVDFFF
jgi:hypothetical protein